EGVRHLDPPQVEALGEVLGRERAAVEMHPAIADLEHVLLCGLGRRRLGLSDGRRRGDGREEDGEGEVAERHHGRGCCPSERSVRVVRMRTSMCAGTAPSPTGCTPSSRSPGVAPAPNGTGGAPHESPSLASAICWRRSERRRTSSAASHVPAGTAPSSAATPSRSAARAARSRPASGWAKAATGGGATARAAAVVGAVGDGAGERGDGPGAAWAEGGEDEEDLDEPAAEGAA